MSKVVVIGGGAAGMFASIAAAGCGHQVVVYEKNENLITAKRCLRKLKSLERNFISREKADAILPMPVIWKVCSMRSEQMQSFYTVVFMDTRISR